MSEFKNDGLLSKAEVPEVLSPEELRKRNLARDKFIESKGGTPVITPDKKEVPSKTASAQRTAERIENARKRAEYIKTMKEKHGI